MISSSLSSSSSYWDDLESLLHQEFVSILKEYIIKLPILSSDTRTDFTSLLKFITQERSSYRSTVEALGISLPASTIPSSPSAEISYFTCACEDLNEKVLFLLNNDLDSFSPEFSHFPQILEKYKLVSPSLLADLCLKYWPNRYPSIKTSFIIPLMSEVVDQIPHSHALKHRICNRLLKGKLYPFDASIKLLKSPSMSALISPRGLESFVDVRLSILKEIVGSPSTPEETAHVLNQPGCHCD